MLEDLDYVNSSEGVTFMDINKVKSNINLIQHKLETCDASEPIPCNPYSLASIIQYIKYLENQVDLNKFTPDEEDRMNILFIKGRFGDIAKTVYKSDGYDFGDRKWVCELMKPIKKVDKVEGTLYEIISALQILKDLKGDKK